DRGAGHFFAISKPSPADFSATISTEATPSRRAKALGWQTHPRGDIGRQRLFAPVANRPRSITDIDADGDEAGSGVRFRCPLKSVPNSLARNKEEERLHCSR